MNTELTTITPELAAEWLAHSNGRQRKVVPSLVSKYSRDMAGGRWSANGESIKLAPDGTIIDGQHRLLACVKAQVAFITLVVHGLDPASFDTIDIGYNRTLGQILSMAGVADANLMAAVGKLVWKQLHHGCPVVAPHPTVPEVEVVLREHPEISASVPYGKRTLFILPARGGVFLHWLFSRDNPLLANSFFTYLETGEELRTDEPVYSLRERLGRNKAARTKLDLKTMLALAIKAYKSERDGTRLKLLRWSPEEGWPEL